MSQNDDSVMQRVKSLKLNQSYTEQMLLRNISEIYN